MAARKKTTEVVAAGVAKVEPKKPARDPSKRKIDGKYRNTDADQAWIEANADRLEVIDDEDLVRTDARMRFTGDTSQIGSMFVLPDEKQRCVGTAYVRDDEGKKILGKDDLPLRRPCSHWPMKGTSVCVVHGGGVPSVKQAALNRLISGLDAASGELVRLATSEDVEDAVKVRAIGSLMDRVGLRAGVEVSIEVPAWQQMMRDWVNEGNDDSDDEADDDIKAGGDR